MATKSDAPRPGPGTQIADWRLERSLGRGGQGEVWKVRHATAKHSPPRAMKICITTEPQARARFEREVQLLQGLAHPNIVPVVEADLSWSARGKLPELSFAVLELADATLEQLAEGDGNLFASLRIFREVLAAIETLHSRADPVLHRDLKPSNILVGHDPVRAMLTDFGIAAAASTIGDLTATAEVVGSETYRAPEVAKGAPATVQSEIYSLGKILERIITAERPDQLEPRAVPIDSPLSPDAREVLSRVVKRAVAWDPAARFASVAELMASVPELRIDIARDATAQAAPPAISVLHDLKEYLPEPRFRIKLRELVNTSIETAYRACRTDRFSLQHEDISGENLLARLNDYEAAVTAARNIAIVGAYYGDEAQHDLWVGAVERLAQGLGEAGRVVLIELQLYPALILQYSVGLAAIAGGHFALLDKVITGPTVRRLERELPASKHLNPHYVLKLDLQRTLPGYVDRKTPLSDHLFTLFSGSPLREIVPDDKRYAELFDRFEYYRALSFAALYGGDGEPRFNWVPFGRFHWHNQHSDEQWLPNRVQGELAQLGKNWPPVAGGFLSGDIQLAIKAQQRVLGFIGQLW